MTGQRLASDNGKSAVPVELDAAWVSSQDQFLANPVLYAFSGSAKYRHRQHADRRWIQ